MTEWLPEMASCLRKSLEELLNDDMKRNNTNTTNSNSGSSSSKKLFSICFGGRETVTDDEKVILTRFCTAIDDYSISIANLYKVFLHCNTYQATYIHE
jgi:hypothetical protein